MILMYAKDAKDGPLLMVGLVPENIERIRKGDPIMMKMRERLPELPDWTLFIGHNCKAKDNQEKVINICFHDTALDRFVQRRMWHIPAQVAEMPFSLMIFYTENEDRFLAEQIQGGIDIKHFFDDRGGTLN